VRACFDELKQSMIDYVRAKTETEGIAFAGKGIRALPGVEDLLKRLKAKSDGDGAKQRGRLFVGLGTGNLEPIGWLKMESLGLKPLFTSPPLGGFGTDFMVEALQPHNPQFSRFFSIS